MRDIRPRSGRGDPIRDTPIRVRMPDELHDLVTAALERDQLNLSAWVREVLTMAATSPLTLPEQLDRLRSDPPPKVNGHRKWNSPNPQLRLGLSVVARTCLHRADLIVRFPTFRRCVECGQEWSV